MARPKKSHETKLTDIVKMRLTAAQLAKLDELTERHGLSRSRFLREILENGVVRIQTLPELNVEAVTLLRKIGGLLAALMKKFPTEAEDLQTLRQRAHRLAAHFSGLEES